MSKYADALLYGKQENKIIALQALGVPSTTFELDDDAKAFPHIAIVEDVIWIWSVEDQVWVSVVGFTNDIIVERIVLTPGGNSYEVVDGQMAYNFILKPAEADTLKIGLTNGSDDLMSERDFIANKSYSLSTDVIADGEDVLIYVTGITTELMVTVYKRKL